MVASGRDCSSILAVATAAVRRRERELAKNAESVADFNRLRVPERSILVVLKAIKHFAFLVPPRFVEFKNALLIACGLTSTPVFILDVRSGMSVIVPVTRRVAVS